MKKFVKIFILILTLALIFVSINKTHQIVYADDNVDTHNHDAMQAWSNTTSLPNSGSYYLVNNVTINTTCTISGTLNLCLNGYGIKFTGTNISNGSIFIINDGKTLNLYDCGTTEHKFRVSTPNVGTTFDDVPNFECIAGLAMVDDNLTENYDTFTGGYITGGIGTSIGYDYYHGGAIYILGGTFNMYGGTIIGNTVKGSSSSSGIRGGAVSVQGGNFTMYGGSIIGNNVREDYSGAFGGGIFVGSATINGTSRSAYFTMNGGTIERNSAKTGGGIFVGSISGTTCGVINVNNGAFLNNYASSSGGGILVQSGIVNLNNCLIKGNIANSSGGGMHFYPTTYSSSKMGSTLNMDNCNITENIAGWSSGINIDAESTLNATITSLIGEIKNTHIDNNIATSSVAGFSIDGDSTINNLYSLILTLTNCTINNNKSTSSSIVGFSAGASSSNSVLGPKITMIDCEITGNIGENYSESSYSSSSVGFYYKNKCDLYFAGRIIIKDNYYYSKQTDKYLESNMTIYRKEDTIQLLDNLTEDSYISVKKYKDPYSQNPVNNGTGVVTNGLSGKASIDNFVSDSNEFYLTLENEEVVSKAKAKVIYNRNNINYGVVPSTGYFIPNVEKAVAADCGTLQKDGYTFAGWNTKADGTGILYKTGDEFDISEDITLYAIFEHGNHDDCEFILWTDALAVEQNGEGKTATNSLPSVAGDYFLNQDVILTSTWIVPQGETNLCLNGRGIKFNGNGSVIYVDDDVNLTIYSCNTDIRHYYTNPSNNYGKITSIGDTSASGNYYFSGGYITGGTGTTFDEGTKGGCIFINTGGEVTLSSVQIIGNSANFGGGAYVDEGGKLTLINYANIRNNETVGNDENHIGGGVYVAGEFNMLGGYVNSNYSIGNRGGGIMIDNGTANLSLGNVAGNASKGGLGAGICIWGDDGQLNISGNVIVTNNRDVNNNNAANNIYINDNNHFKIVGELTSNNNSIGISVQTVGVFTSTEEDYLQYHKETVFFSDNTNYMISIEKGQLALIPKGTIAVIIKDDNITYYTNINTAITNWIDGSTLKLLADISGTQIKVSSGSKILDLNNHSITYTSGSVVIIEDGTLTIQDTSINKTKHYYNINRTGVATLSANTTDYYFEGGYFTGGVATDSRGGGLRVTGGNVNITGGTIFACKAGWGGGIWTANTSSVLISGSAAIIGCYSSGNYTSGGGIFCEGSGSITMTGGSIRHNSAQYSGGGVRVSLQEKTGTYFTMTGGEITGNYSNIKQGSGLALDMADRIKLGGSARIYDNVDDNLFLKNGGYITIVEQFNEDALIVIRTQTLPTANNPIVITDQWTNIMDDAGYKRIFVWNDNSYRISKNSSGELVAAILHTHNWVYTATDNVITATCDSDDGCDVESATLTLNVEGKVYDATQVVAVVVMSSEWNSENGLPTTYEIVYTGNINVGTYTASVTISEVNATKEFVITPITDEVIVTITGNNNTVSYDAQDHSITGYVAVASNELYDVTKDFTFNSTAEALRLDAGTTYMGLTSDMFEDTYGNFTNVIFEIVDGYMTINTVDAVITTLPKVKDLLTNGLEQELIVQGEVDGGTLYYALVDDVNVIPNIDDYDTKLPTAKNAGYYFIWYKVVSDKNHNDLAPVQLKMILATPDWIIINGVLYQNDEETKLSNVKVSLKKGNQTIDSILTNENGEYSFKIKVGVYNIIAELDTNVETILVEAFTSVEQNIVMSNTKTESKLEVNTNDDSYLGILVGGLDKEANSIRNDEEVSSESSVSVLMTIEPKTKDDALNAEEIMSSAKNQTFEFLEVLIKKTIGSITTSLSETKNILELVIPYEKINRHDLIVYSYHDSAVKTFIELQTGDEIIDGSFRLDKENHYIYIYSSSFSTFAIAYTPHYKVDTTLSLGSFTGKVNITLSSQDDEAAYTISNVEVGKVSFADIPMGDYVMTVTWEDGVMNTLTMPIRISGQDSNIIESSEANSDEDDSSSDTIENLSANDLDNQDSEIQLLTQSEIERNGLEAILSTIVSNHNNEAVFKSENVAYLEIGYTDKHGNPVFFDDGYIKKTKEN